jgi:hypothetical protein
MAFSQVVFRDFLLNSIWVVCANRQERKIKIDFAVGAGL